MWSSCSLGYTGKILQDFKSRKITIKKEKKNIESYFTVLDFKD